MSLHTLTCFSSQFKVFIKHDYAWVNLDPGIFIIDSDFASCDFATNGRTDTVELYDFSPTPSLTIPLGSTIKHITVSSVNVYDPINTGKEFIQTMQLGTFGSELGSPIQTTFQIFDFQENHPNTGTPTEWGNAGVFGNPAFYDANFAIFFDLENLSFSNGASQIDAIQLDITYDDGHGPHGAAYIDGGYY